MPDHLYVVMLLILGLCPLQALRLPPADQQARSVPIVLGTSMIDDAEMNGNQPLFVDAFYNSENSVVHVVLNMFSFKPKDKRASKEAIALWGKNTQWMCEWSQDIDLHRSSTSERSVRQQVWGRTNLDALGNNSQPSFSSTCADDCRNATVEPSFSDRYNWALVVSCPRSLDSSTTHLNLRARQGDKVTYERFGIPAKPATLVKNDLDYALCTMINRNALTEAEYLRPWAQYHLTAGFQQLLVYVEEPETTWAEEALRQFIQQDRVTIVPFYFGKVSAQKRFLMQGAMENHCLYQAKGKTTWLGHIDIDEYFDFIGAQFQLSQHFSHLNSNDIALVGRSQFWGRRGTPVESGSPFPCNLVCKRKGYFSTGVRSKLIMKPQPVLAMFPHSIAHKPGHKVVTLNPEREMRVNHFKKCNTQGDGCTVKDHQCFEDLSFQDRCKAMLDN